MKTKHLARRMIAALTAMILLLTLALPLSFAKNETQTLKVMSLSDTHVILESMIKGTADYQHAVNLDQKVFNESEAVLDAQLQKVREVKPDVLILNGDITKDGEYKGHVAVAKKLRQLKKVLPGMKVYVTNGNHDINNSDAKEFNTADGKAIPAKKTTQEDFLAIYKDITWEDATIRDTYTPPEGCEAGATSYMARPAKGYTVIVVDSNRYTPDNSEDGDYEHSTSGRIPEDLLNWVKRKIAWANKRGDTVIGVMHHGVVAHFSMEQNILGDFLVNDFERISTELADAGMHYVFTGHFHSQDVSVMRTEAGNQLYDIETGSSITYPCPCRVTTFTRSNAGKADTDNGVTETVSGYTIQNLSIAHTDPQTGKYVSIPDMTAFSKTKGIDSDVISTVLKDRLKTLFADNGIDYPAAINSAIDKLIPDLADMPVTKDGQHTLIETVNYAHKAHLAGLDNGVNPAWYEEARQNVEDGRFLASLMDVLTRDIGELLAGPYGEVLHHVLFGAANVSYYTVPQIAESFNEFLALTLDSLTYDKNFGSDVTFYVTGANVVKPGEADWSSIDNGLDNNLVAKVIALLLGNGKD